MKNGLIYDGRVAQRQSARLLSVMSRYRNSPLPPPPRANVEVKRMRGLLTLKFIYWIVKMAGA